MNASIIPWTDLWCIWGTERPFCGSIQCAGQTPHRQNRGRNKSGSYGIFIAEFVESRIFHKDSCATCKQTLSFGWFHMIPLWQTWFKVEVIARSLHFSIIDSWMFEVTWSRMTRNSRHGGKALLKRVIVLSGKCWESLWKIFTEEFPSLWETPHGWGWPMCQMTWPLDPRHEVLLDGDGQMVKSIFRYV